MVSTPSRRCSVGGDAAQAGRRRRHRPSAVEDALVGLADEGDLVGLRLHDLDAGELAPQAALHGEDRAEQRDALDACARAAPAPSASTMLISGIGSAASAAAMQMCGVTAGITAASAPARASRSMKPAR